MKAAEHVVRALSTDELLVIPRRDPLSDAAADHERELEAQRAQKRLTSTRLSAHATPFVPPGSAPKETSAPLIAPASEADNAAAAKEEQAVIAHTAQAQADQEEADADEVEEEEEEDDDDDDEAFVYQPADRSAPMPITGLRRSVNATANGSGPYGLSATPTACFPTPPARAASLKGSSPGTARPSQSEMICEACRTGSLDELRALLPPGDRAAALANTPHPKSGLLPIHYAATRGSVGHVSYLLSECGAFSDGDDPSGETALHKAALKGHEHVVRALVDRGGLQIVESADSDGWTALHNAASKGFLDIVRVLVELGADVDRKNKLGITALMCAASRGHSVVVRYLLSERGGKANPFVRNQSGETAYDNAAASFECHCADVLAAEEAKRWAASHSADEPYNPLALHVNVAVVLHENQRVPSKAILSGTRAPFSSSSLLRGDKRTPFTMPPGPLHSSTAHLSVFRSDVSLPTVDTPFELPLPSAARRASAGGTPSRPVSPMPVQPERSHFWLSDWAIDHTMPACDLEEGWSYASSFDAAGDAWTSTMPIEGSDKVVRYRRWIRVMRRRLDRPALPFADETDAPEQELADVTGSSDFIARAKMQADGVAADADALSAKSGSTGRTHARRMVSRLEAAITELRNGLAAEEDAARAREAETLLETYERRLQDVRNELGPIDAVTAEARSARSTSLSSVRSGGDYFSSQQSTAPSSLGVLSPDIRLPTRERPVTTPNLTTADLPPPSPAARWQPDEDARSCVLCSKNFSLFLRKHHCRLCGRVVCANCSSHTDPIDPSRLVPDPHAPSPFLLGPGSASSKHRTCDECHRELAAAAQGPLPSRASAPASPMTSVASDISELTECVVCGESLAPLGPKAVQEAHVEACLQRGNGSVSNSNRYIEFRLPATSPLNGVECEVCLEELLPGQAIARLACLCSFHSNCARSWVGRGKGCPVHALRESL